MLSRRQFMSRGLLVAAGGLTIPSWAQWLSEKMERLQPRKYVQLAEPRKSLFKPEFQQGLRPIPGQPGLFYSKSGRIIGIGDFKESDKWSTVEIPRRLSDGQTTILFPKHPRRYEIHYPIHNARIRGVG